MRPDQITDLLPDISLVTAAFAVAGLVVNAPAAAIVLALMAIGQGGFVMLTNPRIPRIDGDERRESS